MANQVVVKVIVEKYGQGGEGDGDGLYSCINSIFGGGGREDCSVIGTSPRDVQPSEGEGQSHPGSQIPVVSHGTTCALPALYLSNRPTTKTLGGTPETNMEAILWYLEDDTGEVGIVARLSVVPVVERVEIVHDAFAPVAHHPSDVTLRFRGSLRASGDVPFRTARVDASGTGR